MPESNGDLDSYVRYYIHKMLQMIGLCEDIFTKNAG